MIRNSRMIFSYGLKITVSKKFQKITLGPAYVSEQGLVLDPPVYIRFNRHVKLY